MAMTYEEVLRKLGRRQSVQIDKRRGTDIRIAPGEAGVQGDIEVRYRMIPVVTLHADHTYTLRTGGLATKTVLRRIAEYSPVQITRRGGRIFIEYPDERRLVPFFEGTRVDMQGHVILSDEGVELSVLRGALSARATPIEAREGESVPGVPESVIDHERFKAFIRQLIVEVMTEHVSPVDVLPRKVRMRATVSHSPQAGERGEPMVPFSTLERIAGLNKEQAARELRELEGAFKRGGDPRRGDKKPTEVKLRAPNFATCTTCGERLVAHYDRRNVYRGCDYALEHPWKEELTPS